MFGTSLVENMKIFSFHMFHSSRMRPGEVIYRAHCMNIILVAWETWVLFFLLFCRGSLKGALHSSGVIELELDVL